MKIFIYFLFVSILLYPIRSESKNIFEKESFGISDLVLTGVSLIAFAKIETSGEQKIKKNFKPFSLDITTRNKLLWKNTQLAGTVSDRLRSGLFLTTALSPYIINSKFTKPEFNAALFAGEAVLATHFFSQLIKQSARHTRPEYYYNQSGSTISESFISGHTSTSFSMASVITIYAYEFGWLKKKTRWLVPVAAYSLAGSVGYLRIGADRHWLSDVTVGAFAGTAITYLWYYIKFYLPITKRNNYNTLLGLNIKNSSEISMSINFSFF